MTALEGASYDEAAGSSGPRPAPCARPSAALARSWRQPDGPLASRPDPRGMERRRRRSPPAGDAATTGRGPRGFCRPVAGRSGRCRRGPPRCRGLARSPWVDGTWRRSCPVGSPSATIVETPAPSASPTPTHADAADHAGADTDRDPDTDRHADDRRVRPRGPRGQDHHVGGSRGLRIADVEVTNSGP